MKYPDIDFQGHRGCRGIYPENSIPGFLEALRLGVTTLEMDTVISKDKEVVVSHDPFFSHEISLQPDGVPISEDFERSFNLYQLVYREILEFDCGSKVHPRFPQQKKMRVYKPLLREVITAAESYGEIHKLPPIRYNIEIKSTVEGDNIFHPGIEEFSELLYDVLLKYEILDRTIVQCFDIRVLQYLKKVHPEVTLSFLVENSLGIKENIRMLEFVPQIYSPEYIYVDAFCVKYAKENNMKVIPWTINDLDTMRKMIDLGVDGLISDYPDLYKQL